MASFEFLAIILTGIGLMVSITYYAMVLRNHNQTRQAQLFMQVHSQWKDRNFIKGFYDALNNWEWDSVEDFWSKYGQDVNEEAFITGTEIILLGIRLTQQCLLRLQKTGRYRRPITGQT